jgi:heme/copper-type cytochrome/quinol oxidase subunit 2
MQEEVDAKNKRIADNQQTNLEIKNSNNVAILTKKKLIIYEIVERIRSPQFYFLKEHTIDTAKVPQHQSLETIWTIIPTIILVFIAIPSFALLYAINELVGPKITFKVDGNQWFWNYEITFQKLPQFLVTLTDIINVFFFS